MPTSSTPIPAFPMQVVLRFYRAIDDRDYAGLVSLFAPDGVWLRQGTELRGEDEIMAALNQRSATLRVVHIITNLYEEFVDDGEVDVHGYMAVVLNDPKTPHEGPMPLAGIDSIRPTWARLRSTGEGWRIVRIGSGAPTFAN